MSADTIYLALYKGRRDGAWYQPKVAAARLSDWIIRTLTRSPYSHCELAVLIPPPDGDPDDHAVFDCYSSSIRDGGVRRKIMPLPPDKWDLLPLPDISGRLKARFTQTQGQAYDWPGALGVVFKTCERGDKWFCSEWCGQVLGLPESWRFSPNDLAAVSRAVFDIKRK